MNAQTVFIATLRVKDGREADLERLQSELSVLAHRHEPDTIVYDILKSRERPQTYVVYARFKDQAAFEFHQHTDFHDRLVPGIVDTLVAQFEIEFFDYVA
jgi:quinol monooxygenase YgiN